MTLASMKLNWWLASNMGIQRCEHLSWPLMAHSCSWSRFPSLLQVSPMKIAGRYLQLNLNTLQTVRIPARESSASWVGFIAFRSVCEPALYHRQRGFLQLPVALCWCKGSTTIWISSRSVGTRVVAVSWFVGHAFVQNSWLIQWHSRRCRVFILRFSWILECFSVSWCIWIMFWGS